MHKFTDNHNETRKTAQSAARDAARKAAQEAAQEAARKAMRKERWERLDAYLSNNYTVNNSPY